MTQFAVAVTSQNALGHAAHAKADSDDPCDMARAGHHCSDWLMCVWCE